MPFNLIDTKSLATDAVDNTILDLTSNYAFTGTITGAGGGKIAQVVAGSSAGVVSTNSSSFLVCATVNITPTATNSKILIFGGVGEPDFCDGQLTSRFFRDSTELNSSEEKISTELGRGLANTGSETHRGTITQQVLDCPNTTSQVTYTVKMKNNTSGTVRVGNGASNTIIVLEVLA